MGDLCEGTMPTPPRYRHFDRGRLGPFWHLGPREGLFNRCQSMEIGSNGAVILDETLIEICIAKKVLNLLAR